MKKSSEKILMCIQVSQLQTESPADGIKRFNIKYIFEDGSELQLKSNRVVLPQLPGDSFDPNWIQTDLDTVEFFRNVPKNMNSHKIQKLIQYTKFQQWLKAHHVRHPFREILLSTSPIRHILSQ